MDTTGPPPPQQQAPPADAAPLCATAAAMHPALKASSPSIFASSSPFATEPSKPTTTTNDELPKCSRRRDADAHAHAASSQRTVPGQCASGNLWNHSCEERDIPGPESRSIGIFLEAHAKYVESECAQLCDSAQVPLYHVSDLRQEPTVDNIIAHHLYLDYLQHEQNNLRCWSNMIQDQIMGEAQQVHEELGRMMHVLEQQQQQQTPSRPISTTCSTSKTCSTSSSTTCSVKYTVASEARPTNAIIDELSPSQSTISSTARSRPMDSVLPELEEAINA